MMWQSLVKIYRTKVIVPKPVWTPVRHTQSHNTAEKDVQKGYKRGPNSISEFGPLLYPFCTSFSAVLCDWVWRAGVHTGFGTITLVLYIFTKLCLSKNILIVRDLDLWPNDPKINRVLPFHRDICGQVCLKSKIQN
jgi:hypothetical protein